MDPVPAEDANFEDEYLDEEDEQDPFHSSNAEQVPDKGGNDVTTAPMPLDIVIIPKIIGGKVDDVNENYEKLLADEVENEEDLHQHFFTDQLHFVRPMWPRFWFGVVAMIAFSVDESNLSRFPYNISKYGGITFLIAYCSVFVLFVYPMLYLEVIVGQYFQTAMIGVWGLSPIARGLGAGLFYVTFLVVSILPINTLYAGRMMWEALSSVKTGSLRWVKCSNNWNSCNCRGNRIPQCIQLKTMKNQTDDVSYSPALEYFIAHTLQMWKSMLYDSVTVKEITQNGNWTTAFGFNNDKEGLGQLIPSSCFILLGIFILVISLNLMNLKNLGYLYTFSSSFPFLVLALMFCRSVTLEGAMSGLQKYLATDLRKLFHWTTWRVAFESAFFSIGTGCGVHIVMASFNPLNHNAHRDVVICLIVDFLTSLVACVVSFMFVGHLYAIQHLPLPDQFPSQNFIFVTFAESFSSISGSSFFAVLFYFTVSIITIDTQVVTVHTMAFSLYEEYNRKYPDQNVSKLHFLFGVGGFAFSTNLMCATRGGYWLFTFLNEYMFGFSLFLFMWIETIALSWVWGIDEICVAAETVLGNRPNLYLRICWKFILPIVLTALLYLLSPSGLLPPVRVFDQTGSNFTAHMGTVCFWIPIVLVSAYTIYTYFRIRRKGRTCLEVFVLFLTPEYDHEKILEDVKNSKRLTWRHYFFLQFEDEKEKCSVSMNESLGKWQQKMKNMCTAIQGPTKKSEKQAIEAPSKSTIITGKTTKDDRKKEKKKKKKAQEQKLEDESNARNLWDMLQKDTKGDKEEKKEENGDEGAEVEEVNEKETGKKKVRRKQSKASKTSKDNKIKKKNIPVKTKMQAKGSKVKPTGPEQV